VSIEDYGRVPFIPAQTLRQHKVYDNGDDRFRSAARLRQALFREEHSWPIGRYTTAKGTKRKMGNYLSEAAAHEGANFISPEIAKLVRREVAYREDGALIDETRLHTNMLSSHPAVFNFFGGMKLDLDLATSTWQSIAPDFVGDVTDVLFEHSPARRHPAFTNDRTAFDVLLKCTTVQHHRNGFIAVELKYSETMQEPPATLRPRYDELSRLSGLYKDPDHPALRSNPLQLLWRQHMLSQAMIMNGMYTCGRFIVVAPSYNFHVQDAVHEYRQHLAGGEAVEFDIVSFDDLTKCIARAGGEDLSRALHARYCDFKAVDELI
jgi:hypothetical protein